RNAAICPDAGITLATGARPVELPSGLNSSKVTVAEEVVVLATAIPLWMFPGCPEAPEFWTYIRKAVPWFAGAPASLTVIVEGLKEKTANGVGAAPPPVGTT